MQIYDQDVDRLAKKIWDHMLMHQELRPADCIIALGSSDIRVGEYAVELYKRGLAPRILFSGGFGHVTKDLYKEPEAQLWASLARERGVPETAMLIEDKSSNTRENIAFSMQLLRECGYASDILVLVNKPYMERRTYATFAKQFPEKTCIITSPPLSYETYQNDKITKPFFIKIMLGDLCGIKELAEKGAQIPQEIPQEVWQAYETLTAAGYAE